MSDKGYAVITGDAIGKYRARVILSAMRLELRGIRPSRRSAFAVAAEELNVPTPRSRRQKERLMERWEAENGD